LDQLAVGAARRTAHLDQTFGVGGVWRADHQKRVDLGGNRLDRRLTVRRGIADVIMRGRDDGGEPRLKCSGDFGGVIHRQRGLGDEGQLGRVAHLQFGHIGCGFHQQNLARRQLPHGANHFGVAFVADHDHLDAVFVVPGGLVMHLGHQGAGCINGDHIAFLRFGGHGFRHTMRREDHGPVGRAFVKLLDEDGAFGPQPINHEFVVHDFVPHKDRRAPFLDRQLDDLDRPIHARTKAARCGEV
jgi:hypothetical protein